jgi:hypothetical protein
MEKKKLGQPGTGHCMPGFMPAIFGESFPGSDVTLLE